MTTNRVGWPAPARNSIRATRRRVLDDASPLSVIRGLDVADGLVVLSGAWAGGGVVIAQDPVRTTTDRAGLGEVFGTWAIDGLTSDTLGGGWFGWIGYPQSGGGTTARPHWFGLYPNVIRYSRPEAAWFDEAVTGVVDDDDLAARREPAAGAIRAAASRSRTAHAGYRMGLLRANVSAGQYTSAVERCIDRIRAGDIYQANVCLRLEAEFAGDLVALFADLLEEFDPAYAALICGPDFAVVSMSPELFLHRRGRDVVSAPIKGTRPCTADTGFDPQVERLRRSEKERAENIMIVDLVRNDLARVAEAGSVTVPTLLQVERHCGVWHLVSRVAARLSDGTSDKALLDATFPPGSVTGAPKLSAQQLIDKLETAPRGMYTGAVGFVSPAAGLELSVAIRTLELTGRSDRSRRAALGVGAGVTAGSTPAQEWWECLDKAAPLAAAMGTSVVADGSTRSAPVAHDVAGIFETMLVLDGAVVDLEPHLARLSRSVSELWDEQLPATLGDGARAHARGLSRPAARLRIDIKPDRVGRLRIATRSGQVLRPSPIACQPGTRLRTATVEGGFGAHKWADRSAIDVLEARNRGRQLLVVDADEHCLETTQGNVVVFRGRTVVSPPLDGRIVPGITRRTVLDIAAELGLEIEVRAVPLTELGDADGLGVCSSLSGLTWVRWCPMRSWAAPAEAMIEISAALLTRWCTVPSLSPPLRPGSGSGEELESA